MCTGLQEIQSVFCFPDFMALLSHMFRMSYIRIYFCWSLLLGCCMCLQNSDTNFW